MMACHAQLRPTLCMLFKGDDVLPPPMLFDRVFYPRALMACHARHHPTMCSIQGRSWHVTPDVVRLHVLPNGNVVFSTQDMIRSCVLSKGHAGMPLLRSSDRMCCPRAMLTCHARRRPIVLLSKNHDGMPRMTSPDHVCNPRAIIALPRPT